MVPCNLAYAKIPKIGINTAEMQNPKVTSHQRPPDLNPNRGGNIKFPAPKKREKRAKAMTSVFLVLFIMSIGFQQGCPFGGIQWKDRIKVVLGKEVDVLVFARLSKKMNFIEKNA